jgi:hypothetical protein
MTVQTKKEFLETWEDYVVQFGRLGHSTDEPEVWEEIKRSRENMRKVIHKVADEAFGRRPDPGQLRAD